jgi:hypothetical protein
MREPKSESAPAAMRDAYAVITGLTDAFCREHLTDEYATRELIPYIPAQSSGPVSR